MGASQFFRKCIALFFVRAAPFYGVTSKAKGFNFSYRKTFSSFLTRRINKWLCLICKWDLQEVVCHGSSVVPYIWSRILLLSQKLKKWKHYVVTRRRKRIHTLVFTKLYYVVEDQVYLNYGIFIRILSNY